VVIAKTGKMYIILVKMQAVPGNILSAKAEPCLNIGISTIHHSLFRLQDFLTAKLQSSFY